MGLSISVISGYMPELKGILTDNAESQDPQQIGVGYTLFAPSDEAFESLGKSPLSKFLTSVVSSKATLPIIHVQKAHIATSSHPNRINRLFAISVGEVNIEDTIQLVAAHVATRVYNVIEGYRTGIDFQV